MKIKKHFEKSKYKIIFKMIIKKNLSIKRIILYKNIFMS